MIRRAYTAALGLGLLAAAPFYAARAVRRGVGLGLRERLGRWPDDLMAGLRRRRPVWVHAVSVGEVTAAAPLLREIKRRYPSLCVLVTTVTATGRQTVIERVPQADATAYFPLDFPRVVDRVLRVVDPRLFLCVETELWPNFLFGLARRGVPAFLINARLTERSAGRYARARALFGPALDGLYGVAAQTAADAARFAAIGADPSRILITGNLKFDQGLDDSGAPTIDRRAELGLSSQQWLWVAGSTHAAEEPVLLEAYRRLDEPRLVLLLAPRHLDRLDKVEGLVRQAGCEPIRRSALKAGLQGAAAARRVIILDSLGELASFYRGAAVAFVGGTLAPIGGHNLLEPAARAVPVLFGPHTHKCEEIAQALLAAEAGVRVDTVEALCEQVRRLLSDERERAAMGRRGWDMVARNQGAVERTLALLHPWLVG